MHAIAGTPLESYGIAHTRSGVGHESAFVIALLSLPTVQSLPDELYPSTFFGHWNGIRRWGDLKWIELWHFLLCSTTQSSIFDVQERIAMGQSLFVQRGHTTLLSRERDRERERERPYNSTLKRERERERHERKCVIWSSGWVQRKIPGDHKDSADHPTSHALNLNTSTLETDSETTRRTWNGSELTPPQKKRGDRSGATEGRQLTLFRSISFQNTSRKYLRYPRWRTGSQRVEHVSAKAVALCTHEEVSVCVRVFVCSCDETDKECVLFAAFWCMRCISSKPSIPFAVTILGLMAFW